MAKARPTVVVSNVFGPLNRGDEALFDSLRQLLRPMEVNIVGIARDREACANRFDDCEFHEQPGKATHPVGPIRHVIQAFRLFVTWMCRHVPILRWTVPRSQRRAIEAILSADLIIACPGGYLEDSRLSLYAHLSQIRLACGGAADVVLAPMSIGPVTSAVGRRVVRSVLARVDKIFVREGVSFDFVKGMGLDAVLATDLAVSMKIEVIESAEFGERYHRQFARTGESLIATVIGWSYPNAPDPGVAHGEYVAEFSSSIASVARYLRTNVTLLLQVEADLKATQEVRDYLRRAYDLDARIIGFQSLGYREYVGLLSDASLVLASRMHSAIFAMRALTPVVAIGYLPKSRGLFEMYGLADLVCDIEDLKDWELTNQAIRVFDGWRQEYEGLVKRAIRTAQKDAKVFENEVSSRLSSLCV